jgi:hypothetical protein
MPGQPRKGASCLFILGLLMVIMGLAYLALRSYGGSASRGTRVLSWLRDPGSHPEWRTEAGARCGEAPFIFPTDGFAGFLWDDSFRVGHRHQGIDIFSGTDVNVTRVIAAYPGFLTRLPEWKSSVIVRVPDDPLHPGRQIWTYYTHMANPAGESFISTDFPPGTSEQYIEAGTLLGYQGNYSGTPGNPVGVHLHFSVVRDQGGRWLNELEIHNTLDPSPYLGLPLNARTNPDRVPLCEEVTG